MFVTHTHEGTKHNEANNDSSQMKNL